MQVDSFTELRSLSSSQAQSSPAQHDTGVAEKKKKLYLLSPDTHRGRLSCRVLSALAHLTDDRVPPAAAASPSLRVWSHVTSRRAECGRTSGRAGERRCAGGDAPTACHRLTVRHRPPPANERSVRRPTDIADIAGQGRHRTGRVGAQSTDSQPPPTGRQPTVTFSGEVPGSPGSSSIFYNQGPSSTGFSKNFVNKIQGHSIK